MIRCGSRGVDVSFLLDDATVRDALVLPAPAALRPATPPTQATGPCDAEVLAHACQVRCLADAPEPQVWIDADCLWLCHVHQRAGAIALYRVDLRKRHLRLCGVLGLLRHFCHDDATAAAAFIAMPPEGDPPAASPSARWASLQVGGHVESVAFCSGEGDAPQVIAVALFSGGRVATFLLASASSSAPAATLLCTGTPLPGAALLAGAERSAVFGGGVGEVFVTAAPSTGAVAIVAARGCAVLASFAAPGASTARPLTSIALVEPRQTSGAKAVLGVACAGRLGAGVTFATAKRAADSTLEVQLEVVRPSAEVSFELFSATAGAALDPPEFDLREAATTALRAMADDTVAAIAEAPREFSDGVVAVACARGVVLFNRRSKSKNVSEVIVNDTEAPFASCAFMVQPPPPRDENGEAVAVHLVLRVSRADSSSLFFRAVLPTDDAPRTHFTAVAYCGERHSPSSARYFSGRAVDKAATASGASGAGDSSMGRQVLRVRTRRHLLCASEGAPVLALLAIDEGQNSPCDDAQRIVMGGDGRNVAAAAAEFTELGAGDSAAGASHDSAVALMTLLEVRGAPLVVVVRRSGEVLAAPLGSLDPPAMLVPAAAAAEAHATDTTAVLIIPSSSGELRVALGAASGAVSFWQSGRCVSRGFAHSEAVISVMRVPANEERTDAVCMSLSADGSIALYQHRTLDVLCIMHAPCAAMRGVYWDAARELCTLVSAAGANVWHVVTGHLERCIAPAEHALITALCCGTNLLFVQPTHSVTALCAIERVALIGRHAFLLTVSLTALVHAVAALKPQLDASTGSVPAAAALAASPSEGSFIANPNDARYKLPLTPTTATVPSGDAEPSCFESAEAAALTPALRAVLSLLLDGDDGCEELTRLRLALGLRTKPAQLPRIAGPTGVRRYCEHPERTAHAMAAKVAVLRALALGAPVVADLATQCVLHYGKHLPAAVGAAFAKPDVAACMRLMAMPLGPLQFAARITMNSAIRCGTVEEVNAMYEQLSSLRHLGVDPSAALSARAIVVIQLLKRADVSPPMAALPAGLGGDGRVRGIATELERETLLAARAGSNEPFLGALAEGWPVFHGFFSDPTALFSAIFDAFCLKRPTPTSDDYRASHGAKAVTAIALHNVAAFRQFATKAALEGVGGDVVGTRIALLMVFTRMIQSNPPQMLSCFDLVLGFVWRVIDPHIPRKSDRERCYPAVATLLRMAVHCLPTVSFQQHQQRLAVGQQDGTVAVYDAKTTSKLAAFSTGRSAVAAVAYANVGHDIAVVSVALDSVRVYRQDKGGLFGLLNVSVSFHLASTNKIPRSPAMARALADCGGVVPLEKCLEECALLWASPSCVELSSPWHARLQIILV